MARKKLLLVDDSDVVLMTEQMILRNRGAYDCIVAKDGEEAVAKAIGELPDLILLDIVMPKMDGLEACRLLRSRRSTEAIPIIMVTTRGETENVKSAYASGCNDYVTKPINAVELLRKIRNLVGE
jgi:CheY-like chemotaxis protein